MLALCRLNSSDLSGSGIGSGDLVLAGRVLATSKLLILLVLRLLRVSAGASVWSSKRRTFLTSEVLVLALGRTGTTTVWDLAGQVLLVSFELILALGWIGATVRSLAGLSLVLTKLLFLAGQVLLVPFELILALGWIGAT